jgi:hypothetical protein
VTRLQVGVVGTGSIAGPAEDSEFVDVLLGRAEGVRVPVAEALRTQALTWAADQAGRGDPPIRPASWVQDGFRRPAGPGTGAA